MTTKQKIELVTYWRKWWKLYSTWINLAGIAFSGWLLQAPQNALDAWLFLPDDMKALIPVDYAKYVPVALWILAFLARFIRQNKLGNGENPK